MLHESTLTGLAPPEAAAAHQDMSKLYETLPNDPGILKSCARMSLILKDTASGFADLRHADKIRPLEDFADLSMLADLCANLQDLSIAVSIFVLTLEPHAYQRISLPLMRRSRNRNEAVPRRTGGSQYGHREA